MKQKIKDKIKSMFQKICSIGCFIGIAMAIGGDIIREIEKKNPKLKKKWYLRILEIIGLIFVIVFWLTALYILLTLIF